jgi:hypothetical protein
MEQAYDDILKIRNNIFTLTPILASFYSECKQQENNLFLAFVVLPLLFNEEWLGKKQNIRIDSKLTAWVMDNKFKIEGLPSRIDYFWDITIKCLQYAVDMKWLSIQGTTILFNTDKQEWMKSRFYKEQIANAMNLNKLFKDMKVIEILTILGIKDIWRLESNI